MLKYEKTVETLEEINKNYGYIYNVKLGHAHRRPKTFGMGDHLNKIASSMGHKLHMDVLTKLPRLPPDRQYKCHVPCLLSEEIGYIDFLSYTKNVCCMRGIVNLEHKDEVLEVAKEYGFRHPLFLYGFITFLKPMLDALNI